MMNQIILLLVCSALAMVMAAGHFDYLDRGENYINLKRLQFFEHLQDCDTKLEQFRKHYLERVEVVNLQRDMVTYSIIQIEEFLNPLELLSKLNKQCITKYRAQIPTVNYTKTAMNRCVVEASNQLVDILSYALDIRNSLENHIKNKFEGNVKTCRDKYATTKANYTLCITNAISETNEFITQNQKDFETKMDVAECNAKASIKESLACSYTIQRSTISETAATNVMINTCLVKKDEKVECEPCGVFTCPQIHELRMDYKDKTIENPFYLKNNHPDCLMLKFK